MAPLESDLVPAPDDHRVGPIRGHYAGGHEDERLRAGPGRLERARTQEILGRVLPPPPARIADIGGGTGAYAIPLARAGHRVDLVDLMPVHVERAREHAAAAGVGGALVARIGDARDVPLEDESHDAVLLLGPLYHLQDRDDRLIAIAEARRVARPGGVIVVAAISRFASLMDGFYRGLVRDPRFRRIVDGDLAGLGHDNPTDEPEYFTTAFFHHPDELEAELADVGLEEIRVLAVEGPLWCLADFDATWDDPTLRAEMMRWLRVVETDHTLLGASAHLLAVARRPA